MSVYETLSKINVNEHTEKKNGLTYLAWAWAWAEVKKHYPEADYTIYENNEGLFYHHDGRTAWVKTGVTIEGIEHIEYLPIMDYKNKSIPVDMITSFDVNKAIQRSLTKAVARHGLGLYIYAGEDLPDGEKEGKQREAERKDDAQRAAVRKDAIPDTKARALESLLGDNGILVDTIYKLYKVKKLSDLTEAQHSNIFENLDKIKERQDGEQGQAN